MDKSSLGSALCAIIVSSSPIFCAGLVAFVAANFSSLDRNGPTVGAKTAVSETNSDSPDSSGPSTGSEAQVIDSPPKRALVAINVHKRQSDGEDKARALGKRRGKLYTMDSGQIGKTTSRSVVLSPPSSTNRAVTIGHPTGFESKNLPA